MDHNFSGQSQDTDVAAAEFAELRERIAISLAQARKGQFAEGAAEEAINRAFDAARKVRS